MTSDALKDFVSGYSIEVVPNSAAKVESFAETLPANTRVYIAHLSEKEDIKTCLLYTSPSPRDRTRSRMPSSA